MSQLKLGEKAPSFSLVDQHGNTVRLSDFKGRKILLYFYPRANTSGCTRQSCAISEALPDFKKLTVAAVGVSPDTPERQKKFDDKYELNFTLLSDEDRAVAKAFGAWGVKTVRGQNKEGIVRSSFLIDEKGKIAQIWYKVKPEDTVPKALEALKSVH